jgi:hypothetical protein
MFDQTTHNSESHENDLILEAHNTASLHGWHFDPDSTKKSILPYHGTHGLGEISTIFETEKGVFVISQSKNSVFNRLTHLKLIHLNIYAPEQPKVSSHLHMRQLSLINEPHYTDDWHFRTNDHHAKFISNTINFLRKVLPRCKANDRFAGEICDLVDHYLWKINPSFESEVSFGEFMFAMRELLDGKCEIAA